MAFVDLLDQVKDRRMDKLYYGRREDGRRVKLGACSSGSTSAYGPSSSFAVDETAHDTKEEHGTAEPVEEEEFMLLSLPTELLQRIFCYLSYDQTSSLRLVSRKFDMLCRQRLNAGLTRADRLHGIIQREVKARLPRRESERRNHALARHVDILSAVETRLSLLSMTYSKYIELGVICFVPGKVLDEMFQVLQNVRYHPNPPRAHELLQELRDISSMAMEHFDEKIVPGLKQRLQQASTSSELRGALGSDSSSVSTECSRVHEYQRFKTEDLNCRHLGRQKRELQQTLLSRFRQDLLTMRSKSLEQDRKILDQDRKMRDQDIKLNECRTRLNEYEQKFVDINKELARVRAACTAGTSSSKSPGKRVANKLARVATKSTENSSSVMGARVKITDSKSWTSTCSEAGTPASDDILSAADIVTTSGDSELLPETNGRAKSVGKIGGKKSTAVQGSIASSVVIDAGFLMPSNSGAMEEAEKMMDMKEEDVVAVSSKKDAKKNLKRSPVDGSATRKVIPVKGVVGSAASRMKEDDDEPVTVKRKRIKMSQELSSDAAGSSQANAKLTHSTMDAVQMVEPQVVKKRKDKHIKFTSSVERAAEAKEKKQKEQSLVAATCGVMLTASGSEMRVTRLRSVAAAKSKNIK